MKQEDLYLAKYKKFKNGKIKLREYLQVMAKPEQKENESQYKKKKRELGTISKRSLSRTRNTLIELVENNEDKFESFITLTYKEEVEDVDEAYKDLQTYLKSCKNILKKEYGKELYYIAVPEIQSQRAKKSGKYVIHFHLITNM